MIGNDIIDLQLAATQSNWQRRGFLDKLFTEQEQRVISTSENQFRKVWLFWSMKESAYKAYTRKYQERFLAPKKFECHLTTNEDGFVTIEQERYETKSIVTKTYIFTETKSNSQNYLAHDYFDIEPKRLQSRYVYNQIKKVVSEKLSIPVKQLRVRKNVIGIPELFKEKKKLEVLISISHHGNYGAYSIVNKKQ